MEATGDDKSNEIINDLVISHDLPGILSKMIWLNSLFYPIGDFLRKWFKCNYEIHTGRPTPIPGKLKCNILSLRFNTQRPTETSNSQAKIFQTGNQIRNKKKKKKKNKKNLRTLQTMKA